MIYDISNIHCFTVYHRVRYDLIEVKMSSKSYTNTWLTHSYLHVNPKKMTPLDKNTVMVFCVS